MSNLDYVPALAIMEDLTIRFQRADVWDVVHRLETENIEKKERRRKDWYDPATWIN